MKQNKNVCKFIKKKNNNEKHKKYKYLKLGNDLRKMITYNMHITCIHNFLN